MRQRYRHVGALTDDSSVERDRSPEVAALIPRDHIVDLAVDWVSYLREVPRGRTKKTMHVSEFG